jgi:hypothetical protein
MSLSKLVDPDVKLVEAEYNGIEELDAALANEKKFVSKFDSGNACWCRFNDFKNIFAEKFRDKTAFFAQKEAKLYKKIDHNIRFG